MKRLLTAISAVLLVGAMSSLALASLAAGTGVLNSKHDMTWLAKQPGYAAMVGDNEGRVCVFCHTPHHASTDATLDYNPLWNHKATSQTYQPYESASFSFAGRGGIDPLAGPSRLCMSCHDGSVAADQHGGFGGSGEQVGGFMLSGNSVVGSQTHSIDHPIGFDYTISQTARPADLNPTSTTWMGGTGTVGANLHNGTLLTCATCHEPHNKGATSPPAADGKSYNWFVRSPQTGSQLCLTCHNT